MKRLILFLFAFVSLAASAQSEGLRYGYLSYDSVLTAMPEYAVALQNINDLKSKYDAEAKRVEDDFNKKYEEFLDGLNDFPQTILRKRQNELQELMDKNIQFKEESRRLLSSAEKNIFAPLHAKLSAVLKQIGMERGYAFILNTDQNACPFVHPAMGENITTVVENALR